MRISDWSSDVCSSDLGVRLLTVGTQGETLRLVSRAPTQLGQSLVIAAGELAQKVDLPLIGAYQVANALVSAGLIIATAGDAAPPPATLARLQPVRGRPGPAAMTRPAEGPREGEEGGS